MTTEDIKRLCWICFSEGRLGLGTTIEEDQTAFNIWWDRNGWLYLSAPVIVAVVNFDTPCNGDETIETKGN